MLDAPGGPVMATPRRPRALHASVAGSMAGKAAEMVTLGLLATLVPRALGPAAYGRFAVPLTIVTVGSLTLTLGGPTLMARFVPAAPAHERIGLARALGARLARGRAVQLGAITVGAAVAVLLAPERFPPLATALVLAALALNVAATLSLQVGLGLGRTGEWSIRYPAQNAVLIAAVLALHDVGGGAGALLALVMAAAVAAGIGAAVVAPVVTADATPVPIPPRALRFGALQAAGAALVQVTHRGPVLAVALLAGSSVESGYAALAVGIALGVTYAVLQAFTVSLPHVGTAGSDDGEAVLRRLAGGLLAAIAPAAALGVVLLDPLLPTVFSDGYEGAAAAFTPALALVVLAPLTSLLVQVSALRLRPEVALVSGLASAGVFLVVALAAVPAWGASGGTSAALAGTAAAAVLSLWRLPGAAGGRLVVGTAAGVAAVLVLSSLA